MCVCRGMDVYIKSVLSAIQTASYSFFSAVDAVVIVIVAVVVIIGQDANCINSICIQNCSSLGMCAYSSLRSIQITLIYCFKNLWFYVIVRSYAYVCTHINDVLQCPTQENRVCLLFIELIFKWIFKSCPKLKFKYFETLCAICLL